MKKKIRIIGAALMLSTSFTASYAATLVKLQNPTNYCGYLEVNYAGGGSSGQYGSTFSSAYSGNIFTLQAGQSSRIAKVQVRGESGCSGTSFSGTVNCSVNTTTPLKKIIAVSLAINSSGCLYCVAHDA